MVEREAVEREAVEMAVVEREEAVVAVEGRAGEVLAVVEHLEGGEACMEQYQEQLEVCLGAAIVARPEVDIGEVQTAKVEGGMVMEQLGLVLMAGTAGREEAAEAQLLD